MVTIQDDCESKSRRATLEKVRRSTSFYTTSSIPWQGASPKEADQGRDQTKADLPEESAAVQASLKLLSRWILKSGEHVP
jgi:hypothetical protein